MAKSRIAGMLSKLGAILFSALSRLENENRLNRVVKWAKLTLLGLLVIVISTCTKKGSDVVLCYMMEAPPDVAITDIKVIPNPTAGSDQVSVTAKASLIEPDTSGEYVSGVFLRLIDDTTQIDMEPVDGKFDGVSELVRGKVPINGVEPETTWIVIRAGTSRGGYGSEAPQLIITEKDSE